MSTRGLVGPADDALIAGFIVTGNESKTVVLRALGPSLANAGLSGTLPDPVITLIDSAGQMIATNDNWASGGNVGQIETDGLAPSDSAEAALRATLAPGVYSAVVTGKEAAPGIGLVEVYDVSNASNSVLANMSTRGVVGAGPDDLLISGFIVGTLDNSTIVLRSIGPSLAAAGITNPLADPSFTVYDQNGRSRRARSHAEPARTRKSAEAATVLYLPVGAYTAVTVGADGGSGVALIEVYNLELP